MAALHRRACKDWHRRNAALTREGRILERIAATPNPPGPTADPTSRLNWSAVEALLGIEASVTLRRAVQLLVQALRDEIRRKPLEIIEVFGGHGRDEIRDERRG